VRHPKLCALTLSLGSSTSIVMDTRLERDASRRPRHWRVAGGRTTKEYFDLDLVLLAIRVAVILVIIGSNPRTVSFASKVKSPVPVPHNLIGIGK
jgi:hypothetical protein